MTAPVGIECRDCGGSGANPFSDGGDRCWTCRGTGRERKPTCEVMSATGSGGRLQYCGCASPNQDGRCGEHATSHPVSS